MAMLISTKMSFEKYNDRCQSSPLPKQRKDERVFQMLSPTAQKMETTIPSGKTELGGKFSLFTKPERD